MDEAIAEAYAAGFLGRTSWVGVRPRRDGPPRGGRLHLRRGDLPHQLPRGKARLAETQAPLPGFGGGLRAADDREQRGDHLGHPLDHYPRGETFAGLGVEKNGGTRLIGVSGAVNRPGVYELSAGVNLKDIIYHHAGGIKDGKGLKAVIPGGSSTPVLRPDEIDVSYDIESMAKIGTMAGSGGVIVIPEGTCMVRALSVLMNFYAHESCGQCTPCREGRGG